MRKCKKLLLFWMPLLLCLSLINISVMASDEVAARKFIQKNNSTISEILDSANKKVGSTVAEYNESSGVVLFSNKAYNKLSTKKKEAFMREALLGVKESGLGGQVKTRLYNFIADQDGTTAAAIKYLKSDTSADLVAAMSWLRPFTGVISTILGVFCLVIFVMMSVSIVIDMTFITLPAVTYGIVSKDHRPFYISREAWGTVRECENSTEYKSTASIYLKRRVGSMILVGLCLLYLVSGQIYDLFAWLLDSFGNVLHYMFPN